MLCSLAKTEDHQTVAFLLARETSSMDKKPYTPQYSSQTVTNDPFVVSKVINPQRMASNQSSLQRIDILSSGPVLLP